MKNRHKRGANLRLRRIFFLVILGVLTLTPLWANGGDEGISEIPGDEDEIHNELPKRIVQVGSSAFLVTNALYLFPEASSSLVGVVDGTQRQGFFAEDIDPNFANKTILPRGASTEAILALEPDVVVMKDFMKKRMGEPLERMGVETLYLNLETPEAWMDDLDKLGSLFENRRRTDELKAAIRSRVASVEDDLAKLTEENKPEVLLLYWSVKDGAMALNVPPLSWIQTRMVEMAGGIPVWGDVNLGEHWTLTNIEQIALWDPDVIFVVAYHVGVIDVIETIRANDTWRQLRAVLSNQIHAFPADYHSWDQPDIRWLLGLKWLALTLHPEYFKGLDMVDETRAFYEEVYDMGEAEFDRLILPRLTGLD